jgi:hypothetical protein
MAARTDLEIVRLLRGTYTPTWREKAARWTFALFFLLLVLPIGFLLALSQLPLKPGHLPTAIMLWITVPFALAIGLYALFSPYPVYEFDGQRVRCLRGKKTLWETPLVEIVAAEAGEARSNLTLVLRTADRELTLNLYAPLHAAWKALRKKPAGEA